MAVKKSVRVLAFLLALVLALCACSGAAAKSRKKKKNSTVTARPTATATMAPTATPAPTEEPEKENPEKEDPIISPQGIADYLFEHGELPPNFITKLEAIGRGWQTRFRTVAEAAPGMSIGGDRYGNYEGKLPTKKGRKYFEADCNYVSGNRGAERIVYSSDGLVFYTGDHYQTFTEMKPSTP